MMQWLILLLVFPYFFLILRLYLSLRKIRKYKPSAIPKVRLSVIIPCRNESVNLKKILADISVQNYPPDLLEVIVVDDNSADSTFKTASQFAGISNLQVVRNNGTGKKAAIATGVQTSSGELIITTDADCRTDKSWVGTIASFYEKYNSDMIICPVILGRGKGFFGKFQELEFLSLQGITTASAAAGRGTMCNGANLAFKREAYLKHAGNLHDEIPSGDDIFFLHSLKNERGARIFWLESPEATVTTSQAGTPSSFIKQRRRWISKGKAYNDRFTILLAVVTFVTILAQVLSMLAGIVKPVFLMPFAAIFILKSVPDLLILGNTTGRYGRTGLLKWFLPAQLVYPFYVMSVTLSVAGGMIKRRI